MNRFAWLRGPTGARGHQGPHRGARRHRGRSGIGDGIGARRRVVVLTLTHFQTNTHNGFQTLTHTGKGCSNGQCSNTWTGVQTVVQTLFKRQPMGARAAHVEPSHQARQSGRPVPGCPLRHRCLGCPGGLCGCHSSHGHRPSHGPRCSHLHRWLSIGGRG